ELEESQYVVDRILEHREEGIPLTRQAVLFRASHNSDALEVELTRRNIPFVKWGGLRFLEAAHVKDLLAFLRLAENPRDDVSWIRVLQLLEGIGPGRARQAIQQLQQPGDDPRALLSWKAPAAARPAVEELVRVLMELRGPEPGLPLSAQVERVRRVHASLIPERSDHRAECLRC